MSAFLKVPLKAYRGYGNTATGGGGLSKDKGTAWARFSTRECPSSIFQALHKGPQASTLRASLSEREDRVHGRQPATGLDTSGHQESCPSFERSRVRRERIKTRNLRASYAERGFPDEAA